MAQSKVLISLGSKFDFTYHYEWQWVLELVDPLVFVHGGRLPREVGVSGVGGAGQELGKNKYNSGNKNSLGCENTSQVST